MKLKAFIKNELSGWRAWEIWWLLGTCIIICALSIYWKNSLLGIISATTGIAYTVLNGKGKLSAYIFGVINVVTYAIVSYQSKLYGEVMLNVLYYFPLQFYGFYVWSKNINTETNEVNKRRMSNKARIILCATTAAATVIYGFILKALGGALPFTDSLSTVLSVVAMILAIKMYTEQWVLWMIVNAVSVVMWAVVYADGGNDIATLMMWAVYLLTAIIMYFKWKNELKKGQNNESGSV